MADNYAVHSHNFLAKNHAENEWRTWLVILLCVASMVIEITCGVYFGSLALLADGIHMSTHVIAFFITATAYSFARKHADDPAFVFGTGKVGELAAYTSAIILIGIALYILYEGLYRFAFPDELDWLSSLKVAFVGLAVNIASGFLLGCGGSTNADGHDSGHDHGHGHSHGHVNEVYEEIEDDEHDETFFISTPNGVAILSIYEEDMPPCFRIGFDSAYTRIPQTSALSVITKRANGEIQTFFFADMTNPVKGLSSVQSTIEIPEPHEFTATLRISNDAAGGSGFEDFSVEFVEGHGHDHAHGHAHQPAKPLSHDSGHDHASAELEHGHEHEHVAHVVAQQDGHDHGHEHAEHLVDDGHDHGHGHEHGHEHHEEVALVVGVGAVEHSGHDHACDHSPTHDAAANKYNRDNNFRAAVIHVVADAFVSLLVIIALIIAGNVKNTNFLDPLVGCIGSLVILSWSYTLMYDTSRNLLDLNPDLKMTQRMKEKVEKDGTKVLDLHVWRLGPGNLGTILSVVTPIPRSVEYYQQRLAQFKAVTHLTVEIKTKSD